MIRLTITVAAVLALSACDRGKKQPDPAPVASETTPPVQSILRPDFQEENMKPVLDPLNETVGFSEGGYEIDEAAEAKLTGILESVQMKEGGPIILGGHTDASGNDRGNIAASIKRTEVVRDWLIEREVAEDRITMIAFGEQNPVLPNAHPDGTPNEAGREANRRVEVTINIPGSEPTAMMPTDVEPSASPSEAEPLATQTPAN